MAVAGTLEVQMLANMARLQQDMNQAKGMVGGAMKNIESAVASAKAALGGLGIGIGLQQLISMTDQYTKYTSQLRLATDSQTSYNLALTDVRKISRDAQADIGSIGMLYARISNATRELGISQQKVTDVTETVALALKASGASSAESASAILQLSQAFGSGVLRGQEFNAVNEAAPRLMRALADGIGVPVGQLRSMAEAGQLTSQVMANALPKALSDLRKEAAQVQTISGAFTVLKNNVMEFVGAQAQTSGAVNVLTSGIGLLAENLKTLAAVAIGLTVMKLAQWFAAVTTAVYGKVAAVTASIAAAQAERASTIASTTAEAARAEATLAFIATDRAKTIAQMQSAQATIAATAAMGAQSAALAANTAATASYSTALANLANLGRLQATATAQLATAQTALTAATAAGGAAATLGARALGLLGGPIGWITTLLGLGATAWAMWGNAAKTAETDVQTTLYEKTDDIVTSLEKQIKALKERNALAGVSPELAGSQTPQATQLASIMAEMRRVQGDDTLSMVTKTALLESLGRQYGKVKDAIDALNAAQAENKRLTEGSKLEAWFDKNKDLMTTAEKIAAEIKKAKAELGDAFSPEIERRIRSHFAKPVKEADQTFRSLLKSLNEKSILNDQSTESEKLQLTLQGLSPKQRATITPGREKQLQDLAREIDLRNQAKAGLEDYVTQEQASLALEQEVSDIMAARDKATGDAIMAQQKVVEQMRFEVELIGSTNAERETAIALRALETSGIDKQSASYKEFEKQIRQIGDVKKIAEEHEAATKELSEAWRTAAKDMQRSMSNFFFDVMQGNLSDLSKSFTQAINRMVADAAAAKASAVLFGPEFSKGGEMGGLVAQGLAFLGMGGGGGSTASMAAAAGNNGNLEGALLGSFAVGTDYVPKTGPYLIHEGERVLTKEENQKISERPARMSMPITVIAKDANSFRHSENQLNLMQTRLQRRAMRFA